MASGLMGRKDSALVQLAHLCKCSLFKSCPKSSSPLFEVVSSDLTKCKRFLPPRTSLQAGRTRVHVWLFLLNSSSPLYPTWHYYPNRGLQAIAAMVFNPGLHRRSPQSTKSEPPWAGLRQACPSVFSKLAGLSITAWAGLQTHAGHRTKTWVKQQERTVSSNMRFMFKG